MSMSVRVNACTKTHIGSVRPKNEDAFSNFIIDGFETISIVCDGMGGLQAGELASQSAVDTLESKLKASLPDATSTAAVTDALRDAMAAANGAVHGVARQLVAGIPVEDKPLAGTTGVVAVVHQGVLTVAHIGDSRAYLMRSGVLMPLTDDHSFVAEQVKLGHMTEDEARKSRYRNVVTRAIGISPTVQCDISTHPLQDSDRILVCTDGLTTMIQDVEIANILDKADSGTAAAQALIQAALQAGGSDNITVSVIDVAVTDAGTSVISGDYRGHTMRSADEYSAFAANGFAVASNQPESNASLGVPTNEAYRPIQKPEPAKRRKSESSSKSWMLPFALIGILMSVLLVCVMFIDPLRVSLGKRLTGTTTVFEPEVRPEFSRIKYQDPVIFSDRSPARDGILSWSVAGGPAWVGASTSKVFVKNMAGIVEDRFTPRRGQQVSGMAVDPDGNVYITDATRGIIERITLAGNRTTLVSRLKNPSSLVIDSGNGAIYFIDGGILYVVNPVVAGK